MLINFSNHPFEEWSPKQVSVAKKEFDKVVDLPFPVVNPKGDEIYIEMLAQEYLNIIVHKYLSNPLPTIHIMGELNLTISMVRLLQNYGFTCVASTSDRKTFVKNGKKFSEFHFVKFRKY